MLPSSPSSPASPSSSAPPSANKTISAACFQASGDGCTAPNACRAVKWLAAGWLPGWLGRECAIGWEGLDGGFGACMRFLWLPAAAGALITSTAGRQRQQQQQHQLISLNPFSANVKPCPLVVAPTHRTPPTLHTPRPHPMPILT